MDSQRAAEATKSETRPEADHLARARALGIAEAERFELRLRQRESSEREQRLARLVLSGEDELGNQVGAASVSELQLRRQLETLREFQSAVLRSRSWRLLQLIRRPFGRAW